VSAATAKMSGKSKLQLREGWFLSRYQFTRGHEYSAQAVAALACSSVHQGLPQDVRYPAFDTFDGFNFFPGGVRHKVSARILEAAVDEHCASTTVLSATSEARSPQAELISENVDEW